MHTEPRDLDRASLADALERHWAIAPQRLEYVPAGFGTHHWEALGSDGSQWFVSADDLRSPKFGGQPSQASFSQLDRAFRTAQALRGDAGLEFVVAPEQGAGGVVLLRVAGHYAVRVEPFAEAAAIGDGDFETTADRSAVAQMIGRLHAATTRVPAALPAHEDFTLPARAELERALDELGIRWESGPFGEPARELLRQSAGDVRERLAAHDAAAAALLADQSSWVVTHGEPHSANVLRDARGRLLLVDWDTVRIAPPERDLWMVRAEGPSFYRERWALAEICEYISEFRRAHGSSDDTRAAWAELGEYLPGR